MSIQELEQIIIDLRTKTRMDNELGAKSVHEFDKVKARIQDDATGCCNIM